MSDDLTALETELDEAQAALAQLHNTGTSSPALLAEAEAVWRPPRLTWRRPSRSPRQVSNPMTSAGMYQNPGHRHGRKAPRSTVRHGPGRLSCRIRASGRWMPTASHSVRQAGKAGHWRNVRQPPPKPEPEHA